MGKRTEASRVRILEKVGHAAATKSGRWHVVHSSEGWIVKKEGARIGEIIKRREAAINRGRELSGRNGHMVIHAKNGRIKEIRT